MKKLILFYVLFTVSCNSTQQIEKPKDYTQVINEVEKAEIKPELKSKIVNTIKEQSKYSNACYDKILEIEERLKQIETENERLRKENETLREKLATWYKIQFGFWLTVGLLVLAFIIKLLAPIVKTFVRV